MSVHNLSARRQTSERSAHQKGGLPSRSREIITAPTAFRMYNLVHTATHIEKQGIPLLSKWICKMKFRQDTLVNMSTLSLCGEVHFFSVTYTISSGPCHVGARRLIAPPTHMQTTAQSRNPLACFYSTLILVTMTTHCHPIREITTKKKKLTGSTVTCPCLLSMCNLGLWCSWGYESW